MHIDHKRKQPVTHLLKVAGTTESEIREISVTYLVLSGTLEKDAAATQEEALLDTYRKSRSGGPTNAGVA